jgi:transaldolase
MNPLQKIGTFGQSVWLDFISRKAIQDGTLAKYIEDGVVGMTSNPAIFEKAMSGTDYDGEIIALAKAGKSADEIYQQLAVEDVQSAADLLRPIFDRTNGLDGYVSLEVSPLLARDTAGTTSEAKAYWARLGRPNVMIKIPATVEGLPAITEVIGSGINVNVTLLFDVARYQAVAAAYLAGLEQAAKAGHDLSKIRSVASFFLSRIDTLVDGLPEAKEHQGLAAVASAKHAYEAFLEIQGGAQFQTLAEKGAHPQRLLWASTSTKNPAFPDLKYVETLIGPETVNTMPTETIAAVLDHGQPADLLTSDLPKIHEDLADLAGAGIDLLVVSKQLEEEGLKKFVDPFDKLSALLESKRKAALDGALTTTGGI